MTGLRHRGPWRRGRTLSTRQTQRWTKEQWDHNESIEQRNIYANFEVADQGRSRVRLFEIANAELADVDLVLEAPEMLQHFRNLLWCLEHDIEALPRYWENSPLRRDALNSLVKAGGSMADPAQKWMGEWNEDR